MFEEDHQITIEEIIDVLEKANESTLEVKKMIEETLSIVQKNGIKE